MSSSCLKRRARGVAEAAIGLLRHRPEVGVAPGAGDEGRHQPGRRLRVGPAGERRNVRGAEARNGVRRIEAAVARKAGEHGVEESLARRLAARREVVHKKSCDVGRSVLYPR